MDRRRTAVQICFASVLTSVLSPALLVSRYLGAGSWERTGHYCRAREHRYVLVSHVEVVEEFNQQRSIADTSRLMKT